MEQKLSVRRIIATHCISISYSDGTVSFAYLTLGLHPIQRRAHVGTIYIVRIQLLSASECAF